MRPTPHAVHVRGDALAWAPVELPPLGPDDVRVRVLAAGVNRADLVQRRGAYPPPPGASPILGLEVSGVVEEVGEHVSDWQIGDVAVALLTGGGYATHVVTPAATLLPMPAGMDPVAAAAVVEVFATAWLNLWREGGLSRAPAGQRVLVHAGASGVGTAAVQLCRLWGHRSFVTVGSAEKVAAAVALGADGGAVRHDGPWLPLVRAWAPDGVNVILDPVGADYLPDNQAALAADGHLVVIGLLSGRTATLDLGRLLMKRQRVVGSTLRARDVAFKAELLAELRAGVWPAFLDGRLHPCVDAVFPMTEADAAHARLASNVTTGAIVLTPPG